MDELLDLAAALNTLYNYIDWHIDDKDFIKLSQDHYIKLPVSDRNKRWYIINPFKVSKKNSKVTLVVDEKDKQQLLSATLFINIMSQALPNTVGFGERLIYCRKFLPKCVFENYKKLEGGI